MKREEEKVRAREFIDDRLFAFYWKATKDLQSLDLVICINESDSEISAYLRENLANESALPIKMRKKLSKPAKKVDSFRMSATDTTFWLVLLTNDDQCFSMAVNAKIIAPGGNG